jgi:hypothetical protein
MMLPFDKLSMQEKNKFIEQASFLIENRYVNDIPLLELAEKLFLNFVLNSSDSGVKLHNEL